MCGGPWAGPTARSARDPAVEQPHHALDDGDVGPGAAVPEERADQMLADQHRVEVATRQAGGQRVVAGVDEVGADLERRDAVPGRRSAPISPVATVVLPLPDAGAAIRPRPSRGARATRRKWDTARARSRRTCAFVDPGAVSTTTPSPRCSMVTTRCRAGPCGRCPSGA